MFTSLTLPGCNRIFSGANKIKTLFSNLYGLLVVLSYINSIFSSIYFSKKMKYLLCNFKSNEKLEVQNHYLNFHNVDKTNVFFQNHYLNFHNVDKTNVFFQRLFDEKNNVFHGRRCVRCDEFIPTTKFKLFHDFLKHYSDGKNIIEEKPVIVTNIGKITKFEINYQDHSTFYDFYNSESIVDEFLFNIKNKIQRSNVNFLIRSGFSLENIQSAVDDFNESLKNSRYWTTDPIQTKSFSDYVYFTIRKSILKRVINSGLTGSSWHFNRFLYINIKTIKVNYQLMR